MDAPKQPKDLEAVGRSLSAVGALFALALQSTACQQSSPAVPVIASPRVDPAYFQSCVDREAKTAVVRAIQKRGDAALYGYKADIANEVISVCYPTMEGQTFPYVTSSVEAQMEAARNEKSDREAKERRDIDELSLRAENVEEDGIAVNYLRCLVDHAKVLALNSSEVAEVVARASFPSCLQERKALFEAHRRHGHELSPGAMEVVERKFYEELLLEIIKARAEASPLPSPPPTAKSSGKDI